MRLTLRTLLAYLDNTLDRESSETLRGKIAESGFASQLVQRIRASLSLRALSAPSPDAVGPIEDANVISEYLDSTLPNEQVAEIERACLESEPLLAEAAGCHQILTMVLGKPAEVSPTLRERIYGLPQSDEAKQFATISTADTFSSLAIPDEPTLGLDSANSETPTSSLTSAGPAVRPVGPADSGVSDAPTRLRNAGLVNEEANAPDAAAIAGSRPRPTHRTDMYADPIRPSRITPWLVSLALAGVLLFALSQIFSPLLNHRAAKMDGDEHVDYIDSVPGDKDEPVSASQLNDQAASSTEIEVPAEMAPPMIPVGEPARNSDTAGESKTVDDSLPEPNVAQPGTSMQEPASAVDASSSETSQPSPEPARTPDPIAGNSDAVAPAAVAEVATKMDSQPAAEQPEIKQPEMATASPASEPTASVEPQPVVQPVAPAVVEVPAAEAPTGVATLLSDSTLVAVRTADTEWQRLASGGAVTTQMIVNCAPTFRAKLQASDGLNITMSGPTEISLTQEGEEVGLELYRGLLLLRQQSPDQVARVSLGDRPVTVKFSSPDSLLAITLSHSRAAGADPLVDTSRTPEATLMIVQGAAALTSGAVSATLDTGQQWQLNGAADPVPSVAKEIPEWIDEPDVNETSIDSLARSGLLSLLSDKEPIELSLREAVSFRRTEVGALAARCLLQLGRGDVYFGGDGILNNSRQKAYWDDHYLTLMSVVDESAQSAENLQMAIARMESADRDQLFELLTGYSQEQLKSGMDAKLVSLLDSPSMSVRVLALQNLKRITGTTLNYRADQDNAIRRSADVKKWEVRAKKGDIRWPEAVPEA